LTKRQYEAALDKFLDEIFNVKDQLGWSIPQLATKANLCFATVQRINMRETRLPRLHTIMQLADAVGESVGLTRIVRLHKSRKRA
jgi:ribosome-binding protein aMBF1 (putative translation factor)